MTASLPAPPEPLRITDDEGAFAIWLARTAAGAASINKEFL